MKRLHRMILSMLPGPFAASLGTLMFLLLMQFLMRYLPDLVGKGLPYVVIAELITYNLAYMVVLAVPMSVLLATVMAFGRLAETRGYTVIKNAGISLPQVAWPVCVAGLLLMGGMLYFNNIVLPEANFRAKSLWQDIRQKKPGIELEPGVFYNGIPGYSIRVQETLPDTNIVRDVLIFDQRRQGNQRRTMITAERGRLETEADGRELLLNLFDGEIHRLQQPQQADTTEQYEFFTFNRHQIRVDITDLTFRRSDSEDASRSDRTMRTPDMLTLVDSLESIIADKQAEVRHLTRSLATTDNNPTFADSVTLQPRPHVLDSLAGSDAPIGLAGLEYGRKVRLNIVSLRDVRNRQSDLEVIKNSLEWHQQRISRYMVEVHKKFSIAVACIIFVLIGAPLGLHVQRSSMGVVGGLSAGIFLLYWITLVQGEKLADRGYLDPWIGMWTANIIVGLVGLWLFFRVNWDRTTGEPLWRFLHLPEKIWKSIWRSSDR